VSAATGRMRTDLGDGVGAMARGAAHNLGGAIGAVILTFVFNFVITHVVSVGGVGLLSIGVTVVSLATIPALLGLETGTVRFVALGAARDDERAAAAALQVSIAVVLLMSAALTVAAWLLAPALAEHFFHKPDAAPIMRIVALSLPGLALGRVLVAGVQGFGVMTYSAWLGPLRAVVNLATAAAFLGLGLGVEGLAWAAAITATLLAVISFALLLRVHPGALRPAQAWPVGRMLRFSLPQTMTATLFFAVVWTDTLLLGRFGTAAEVGIYAIVGRLLTPATLVSTAIGQMFAPRIAARDAVGDRETLARMLKRVTYWNTAVSLPAFLLLCLIPGPILGIFGSRYTDGAAALAILSLGQLLNTAAGPLGQVINLSGRPYVTLLNNGLVGGINVGVCLILIPRYGLVGAATATATALTLVNVIKLFEVRLLLGMWPFRGDSLRVLAAGALAALVAAPFALVLPWRDSGLQVLLIGTLLLGAYVRLFTLIGVDDDSRELWALGRARMRNVLRPRPMG
jgi:O-antigen/teichoic acid export membrane protein